MAKENMMPVQSGLKGINSPEKEVVTLLRWDISAKAPGEGLGQANGTVLCKPAVIRVRTYSLDAVKDY